MFLLDKSTLPSQLLSLLQSLLNPFHLIGFFGNGLPLFAGLLVIPSDPGRVWLIQSLVQLGNFILVIGLIQLGFYVVKWGVIDRHLSATAKEKNIRDSGEDPPKTASQKFIEGSIFSKLLVIAGGLIVLQAIGLADFRVPYSSTVKILIFIYITTIAIRISLSSRLRPIPILGLKIIGLLTLILASASFVNGAFIPRFLNLTFILFPLIGIMLVREGNKGVINKKRCEDVCLALCALGVVFATFPPITPFIAILPPQFLLLLGFPLVFDTVRKRRAYEATGESYELLAHTVNICLFVSALTSYRGLGG